MKYEKTRIMNFICDFFKERKKILLFLFVIAFLVRLILVLSINYPFNETRIKVTTQDPIVYHQLALSLLDGEGMKSGERGHREYDFRRPPFYPLFLAGIYGVFGENIFYVQIFQIVIGAFTIALFYLLCLEYFDKKISLISAIIFALYLPHAVLSVTIMTEIWTTFFITTTLICITRAYKQNSLAYWLLSGLSYGLLILNRQFYKVVWIFIIIAIVVIYFRDRKYLFRNLIAFLIPLIMIAAPWMLYVKNITGKAKFDTFLPDDYNKFAIFYESIIFAEIKLGYHNTPEEREHLDNELIEVGHLDNKRLLTKYINHIRENPFRFLKTVVYESQFLWVRSFVISGENRGNLLLDVSPLMKKHYLSDKNYPILLINLLTALFGLAGIVGLIRFGFKSIPIAFVVLLTVGAFTFLFTTDRYGLPIHNLIILYSVAGIAWILRFAPFKMRIHCT